MHKKHAIVLVTILLFTAIACELSFGGNSGISEEEISFELTRTSLQQTQTALAQPPAQEPESPPDDADEEAPPEDESDDMDEDDDADEDEDEDPCYFSRWTGDESIPDGTVFEPGDNFVKTWKLRNAGTCDWAPDTRMVFEDGDQLDGPDYVELDETIEPGETITVEIPMEAPSSEGDYVGVWRLTAPDGTKMGKYWVKITVDSDGGSPSPTFAVTSVSYYMPHTTIDMACPGDVNISAEITTNGGGLVSFKWNDSQGCPGCATKSTTFAGAESKIIEHTMTINASGDFWAKIYIDEPNHQWFGQQNFHVNCTP